MKKTYILFLTVILSLLAACQKEENSRSDNFGEGSGALRLEQPAVLSKTEIPVRIHSRFGSINRVQMVHIRNIRVLFLIRL